MLIKTKLVMTTTALGAIAVFSVGLIFYVTERANWVQDNFALRFEGVDELLQLDGQVEDTFILAEHNIFNQDRDYDLDLQQRKSGVAVSLASLENNIVAKSNFFGWTDTETDAELEKLGLLKQEIEDAFVELDEALLDFAEGREDAAKDRARYIIMVRLQRTIGPLMNEILETRRARLLSVQQELQANGQLCRILIIIVALVALGLTSWFVGFILWQLRHGLDVISEGSKKLSAGEFDHRIAWDHDDELGSIATLLNQMAQCMEHNRSTLTKVQAELEQTVEKRTSALAEANEELENRDEMRRQFFAEMGHELRTPVTAIRGQAEVALRAKVDKEAAQVSALERIISLTDQLTQDVSSLFFIAREQAGVLDLRRDPIDLGVLAENCLANMQAYLDSGKAIVSSRIGPGSDFVIDGLENRLNQLITTLISNAIDHSHLGVRIQLQVREAGQYVYMTISDDGPGIPPTERERVFQRFYRLGQNQMNTGFGAGLGLPIARSLVHAHGGVIHIDESLLGGTEINIRFEKSKEAEE